MILSLNLIDFVVVGVILLLATLVIVHLIRVYRASPCGDCASKKECSAFSKKKILKAYKKACKK